MRADLVKLAEAAHKNDPASILKGGDGSAAFAIRFRNGNPDATDLQVIEAVERIYGAAGWPKPDAVP